jgi:hypothetical protein
VDVFLCPPRNGRRLVVDSTLWERAIATAESLSVGGPAPVLTPDDVASLLAALKRRRTVEFRSLVDYLREFGSEGLSLCFRRK